MTGVTQVLSGGAIVIAAVLGAACSQETAAPESTGTAESASTSALKKGEKSFDHTLPTGNGRACSTCHVEADGFALTPAHVQARLAKLGEGEDDPLFRHIDADDPNCDDGHSEETRGQPACTYARLSQGLVRVTLPLPATVAIEGQPDVREVSVWRSVPTIENVALTVPYLQDGRADVPADTGGSTLALLPNANALLQIQAEGAAIGHMQFKKEINDSFANIAVYELDQFSSPGVRHVAEEIAAGHTPKRAYQGTGTNVSPFSDGLLSNDELAGQQKFEFRCGACHGGNRTVDGFLNTGTNTHFHEVSVSLRNLPALPVYTWVITKPGGVVVKAASPDPGRLLITGTVGNPCGVGCVGRNFEGFDTPALYGVGRTAPYFHDNSAATLEDVLVQYNFHFAKIKATGNPVAFVQTQMDAEEMRLIATYLRQL